VAGSRGSSTNHSAIHYYLQFESSSRSLRFGNANFFFFFFFYFFFFFSRRPQAQTKAPPPPPRASQPVSRACSIAVRATHAAACLQQQHANPENRTQMQLKCRDELEKRIATTQLHIYFLVADLCHPARLSSSSAVAASSWDLQR
jgi:hypothetical protein